MWFLNETTTHCTTNKLAKETEVVPERDGKTNCWMTVDGTTFISQKSN
jgi:hypothetical protein